MTDKYSQSNLRISIVSQKINEKTYYYSVCKKNQQTLSFFQNDRLLILDFQQGRLFYLNEYKNLPFKNNIPQAKKQIFALIQNLKIDYTNNSKNINFIFKNKDQIIYWNFQFQKQELASQWIKLIQYQKIRNKDIQDRYVDNKNNRSRVESINNKNQNNNQSQLITDNQLKPIIPKTPIITPKSIYLNQSPNQQSNILNWNHQFYKSRTMKTLYSFQQQCLQCFYRTIQNQQYNQDIIKIYQNQIFIIKIALKYTLNAKKLKNQYRNYHFILDATNKQQILGVPLTCLIQFQNIVALIKAKFTSNAVKLTYDNVFKQEISQLQRYTRIKNKVLEPCLFLDLTKEYQINSRDRRNSVLYIDDLEQYLPVNLQFSNQITLIRPQYMLDHVNFMIVNGPNDKISKTQSRTLRELSHLSISKVSQFANSFWLDNFNIITASQLKNLIHQSGLNLKNLPTLYTSCTHPSIKKYFYTLMASKIIKDYIFQSISKIKNKDPNLNTAKLLQQIIMVLLQGNNNKSYQLWKQISLIFKRKYNIVLNNKEIISGYFFNCIMELIPGDYDVSKINKKKKMFQEGQIINPGFVRKVESKVKCYNRFIEKQLEKIKIEVKEKNIQIGRRDQLCIQILDLLFNYQQNRYQNYYDFGNNSQWMIQFLINYYPPQNLINPNNQQSNTQPISLPQCLFDRINQQPPSYYSLSITNLYLKWCNKAQKTQQFTRIFQKAIQIADYWLQQMHPFRSQLLQTLSQYYSNLGIYDQTIKYLKQSLNISIKFWGINSYHNSLKYYQLAQKYLLIGKRKEALEYYYKAKDNYQGNKIRNDQYGLCLMKLANLCLANMQYDNAIELAKTSIKVYQDYQKISQKGNRTQNQYNKIKSYEILARIYQISNLRTQYKQLALSLARKFNQTKSITIFLKIIKICLAACIFKSNNERCLSFLNLVQIQYQKSKQSKMTKQQALNRLILKNEHAIIMQKFIYKFQIFERSLFQLNNKKRQLQSQNKQFIEILGLIIVGVGGEYVIGLIQQKISCYVQ